MSKIKDFFANTTNGIKNIIKEYPLTMVIVLVLTMFMAIEPNTYNYSDFLQKVFGILILEFFSLFYCESKKWNNRIKYIFITVFSIINIVLINMGFNSHNNADLIGRICITYCIVLMILSIYNCLKNSQKTFYECSIRVFSNLAKLFVSYLILVIGICAITALFIFLILDGEGYEILGRLMILLVGFYLVPFSIKSISDVTEDVGKFIKGLTTYILLPITTIAFIIIYLYMAKLIMLRQMPSNQIFRILAILFIVGMPIIIMCRKYIEIKFVEKITKILPYLFIPFIFLQIYSLGIRCIENGITETRYIGWMLLIFEIVTIILVIYKNYKYMDKILVVLCGIIVISNVVPYVNMYETSVRSQARTLKQYLQAINGEILTDTALSERDKNRIYGAYKYLRYKDEKLKNKYMPKLTDKQIENIESLNKSSSYNKYPTVTSPTYDYITYDNKDEYINLNGYNKLSIWNSYSGDNPKKVVCRNNSNFKVERTFDINEIVQKYIKEYKHDEDLKNVENEFTISENEKIIIKSLDITLKDNTINDIDISLYLLEK